MASAVKILAFAGSMRAGSFNKKLVKLGAAAAERAGAQVTLLELRDLALPLYDGDAEQQQGLPAGARQLKELMIANDGFLISSPEYNSGISGVLKNAIDWASRPEPGEKSLAAFAGKVVALMSASPGAFGGLRGLANVRAILGNIKVLVLPEQVTIAKANEAFNPDGSLKSESQQRSVEEVTGHLVQVLEKLKA